MPTKYGFVYDKSSQFRKLSSEELLIRKRATFKRYYERNKKRIIERTNLYRKTPLRKIYQAKWMKKYRKINPENTMRPERRFKKSVNRATDRGFEWNISFSDYCELISKRCFYCDGDVPKVACGLDRMDNSKGYLIGNVVSCCRNCNVMKSDHLTFDEMVVAMNAIKGFRLRKALVNTCDKSSF